MASLYGFISRLRQSLSPPVVSKSSDPLKFGILGAANIAPLALIIPARSHPEVVIQAVAARDRKRAEAFAKKHGIPEVKNSYQEILDDSSIQCVFIPLPNGLHYEWAVRAIRAGKHVLMEKPSVSNATEAQILFNLPELSRPNAPVLLEAFHYRFFPAWALFLTLVSPPDVIHVEASAVAPPGAIGKDDIRFNYPLAGGAMMDIGTYCLSALRQIFGTEPEECLSCDTQSYTEGNQAKCDYAFAAKFRFPNGAIGDMKGSLRGSWAVKLPRATVTHREVAVPDESLPEGQEKLRTRELTMWNFMVSTIYHRIDIVDSYVIRSKSDGTTIKKWTEKTYRKAYSFKEAGGEFKELPSEIYWMSYRHQLQQFVNRVKGRETLHWVTGEDSIAQMKMMDMAYEKSGLGARLTSSFR